MQITTQHSSPLAPTGNEKPGVPAKGVLEAAQQFEALLMGQILKEVSASAGSFGEADASSSTMSELAIEHLAKYISSRGGFGLASLMARSLSASVPKTSKTVETK
jgi:Rod binding domain-containing protein